jgi:accessory gene regulator protein AgrB
MATTRYLQKVDPKTPYIWAFGWISSCQLGNILTITGIYQIFTNTTLDNDKLLVWSIAIPLSIVNMFFMTTEKKYKWLVEHYKDEKNKKIKGWGVFLYVIGSMLAFGFTGTKLFWVSAVSFS